MVDNESISRALRLAAGLVWALFVAAASAAADAIPSSDAVSSSDTITTVPLTATEIVPAQYNGDLRDLPQVTYTVPRYLHMWNDFEEPRRSRPPVATVNQPVEPAPEVISLAPMPAPSKNFAGLGFSDSVTGGQAGDGWPPDINGDVGPTVYIEAVNDAFGIFDKATGNRLAAFTEDNLWSVSGVSGPCLNKNQGDPVVLYDGLADRWILTNFAYAFNSGNPIAPFYQCIAVSKTGDPVGGGWWFYAVPMDTGGTGEPPAGTVNDYGKFGLWTDCLYMGANGFNSVSGSYAGAIFASFNRTAIFAGQALTSTNSSIGFICTSTDPTSGDCINPFTMIPANLLGISSVSLPPSGTPEYFVDQSGNATTNFLNVRKFIQGANTCGAGSSLSAPVSVSQTQYGYPATEDVSDPSGFTLNIAGQKNTTNKLDSLGDRLMQKVQYRKVGSAESLWVVHTTCGSASDINGVCATSTTTTRPQWAQINVTNKTVATTPVQQQIYAPDTTLYRWMGSLAVDIQGNMALGYSTSSSTAFPSIAYSGRLVADPLNQLPQSETQLITGGGSQTFKLQGAFIISRWGDYSAMSIDPADDCTFWYTNEYYDTQTNGTSGYWQTRIGAFKFPGCFAPPAKLAFTQEPNASYASGATITVKVSIEDAAGNVVTGDTSAVTLALGGGTGGAVLSGTKTVNAVAGVATFSNLTIDKVGTGYVLNATDGSLTGAASTTFNITPGAAKTVTFTTQPATNSNIAAGAAIPLVAHVVDGSGNAVANESITLGFNNNAGGSTLSVTANPVATNAGGDAAFANASLNKVGTGYTLKATDTTTPAATPATSNQFNIIVGAAATISFAQQPSTASVNMAITPAIVVNVQDGSGNAVPGDNVALAIGTNLGGATLAGGNSTATDTNGNATFGAVSLDKVGAGYTLVAADSSASLQTAISNTFNVITGVPTLAFTTQPTNIAAGSVLTTIAVTEEDATGQPVTTDNLSTVDFTVVSACTGSVTLGSAPMVNGVATLSTMTQRFYSVTNVPGLQVGATTGTISGTSQYFAVLANSSLVFADGFDGCRL